MGKSTEITDMVLQQQPENEFCNLTDTLTNNLNSINNNKINNGSHDVDEVLMGVEQPQHDPNILILNDDNNNSNDNFDNPDMGPETDVDAIEEYDGNFQYGGTEAAGGEKEKTQMEFKETDDVTDRVELVLDNAIADISSNANAMFGNSLENKIFEELSLHNPDLIGANNPFTTTANEFIDNLSAEPIITDNKLMEEKIEELQHGLKQEGEYSANDFIEEKMDNVACEIDFVAHEPPTTTAPADVEFEQELISANEVNEEVAIQQQTLDSGE